MRRHFHQLLPLMSLAAGLLLGSPRAHAHFFCVNTAAELQLALTQASDGGVYNGEDNLVYLQTGVYATGSDTGNGPFHFNSTAPYRLYISGGRINNCTGVLSRSILTRLSGGGLTAVLTLRNPNGEIDISNLTLENGESGSPGSGLQINYLTSVNAPVYISGLIVRNNHTTASAGGIYVSGAGSATTDAIQLLSSLFFANSADSGYGAGYVTGYASLSIAHSLTVARNAAAAGMGGMYFGGSTQWSVYDSIFWSNSAEGLELGSNTARLYFNDYGSRTGNAPAQETGSMSVNPQFVDANAFNFRLAGNSPLLGQGYLAFAGSVDPDGHVRPSYRQDIGAFEETIFVGDMEN